MDTRIPLDPERMKFSENKTVAELQKWRHYAAVLVGLASFREVEKRNLMIVPRDMFLRLLKKHDNEAFKIIRDVSTLTDLSGLNHE